VWAAQERGLAVRAAHGLGGPPDDRALDALLRAEGLAVLERCPSAGGCGRSTWTARSASGPASRPGGCAG
jgi:hypothetical protein